VIGGGTGTYTVLKGLRAYSELSLTAIVTMADDGGSNKVLRDEFGLLPTSGIRQCVVALSCKEGLLRQLFSYRYYQGVGISGMTFGNLFMAALSDILGSQKKAIAETCRLLGVRGRILPVTYQPTSLVATYADGTEVLGEHSIDLVSLPLAKKRITSFRTIPTVSISREAAAAIHQADLLILGPGDLYTNTVANLVVQGVSEAIIASRAKLVFVMNLMTSAGETYAYQASDFLTDLSHYLPARRLNYVLLSRPPRLSLGVKKAYAAKHSIPVRDNLAEVWEQAQVLRGNLASSILTHPVAGDKIKRSLVRHSSRSLARALVALLD